MIYVQAVSVTVTCPVMRVQGCETVSCDTAVPIMVRDDTGDMVAPARCPACGTWHAIGTWFVPPEVTV